MGEAAIVVRGLRKRFGAQEAVAGIDLDVAAGSCAGLVGRIPVLLACAACHGIALAWAGVRIAARVAEPRLPELCQIALHSMA